MNCPKCTSPVPDAGVSTIDESWTPIYICPEFLSTGKIGDTTMDLPLAFAIDPESRAFDPTLPDDKMYFGRK